MDSLSTQMLKMTAACTVTYDKTDLISDLGKTGGDSDFQKLIEKAKSGQPDSEVEQPKADKPAAKKDKSPVQKEEDPAEASKRLQVYLKPVSPEELAQYPAEWLPQVEEGEPIVCIGVRTGANGEDIPILVGARQAAQMYGKPMVDPALYDVSDPEADAVLEATDPTVEHGPAQMLEKLADEVSGVEHEAAEAVKPQQEDGSEVEITDVEQAPHRIFHDVEAAPVKVGEVYDAQQTEEPDVAGQIDAQLANALETGESLVRVQLNPENLGSVTVEISQSADGVLHVALSAHNSETRGLLERHAADLQGLLSSRTQQSVEVDVQRGQESQQNQQQQNYDGHNGHAQGGQEERRQQRREHPAGSQDFMQQLRLGLIPSDGEA